MYIHIFYPLWSSRGLFRISFSHCLIFWSPSRLMWLKGGSFFVITAFFSDSCTFTLKFHRSRIAISGSRETGFQSTEYKFSQIPLCIEEQEIKQEVATSLSHAVKKARKIKLAQVVCNWFLWMDASINFAIRNHQLYPAGWHFHSCKDWVEKHNA